MPPVNERCRKLLQNFDFKSLFIEALGWDHCNSALEVSVDGKNYVLTGIAQKRGLVVYILTPSDSHLFPDYPTRRKIERQVARSVHEHLIIYIDTGQTVQIWQWVKREMGKPTACREHTYHHGQSGEALIQKLQNIVFTLEEEEKGISISEVAGRTRTAFDVERVTRRFYDRFKSEHAAFLKFIKHIPDAEMQRWYASVMLNRLMFIYFIQKKGFLDDDVNYLRTKLTQSKQRSKERFYADFLCPLFFEGFAKLEADRSAATNELLGKVPYLNGGLFLRHQIEELHGQNIQIPDLAFEKLFDFFDQYRWHLDERPLRADNEINPDVLGYIFEKYINQKQMGAYYTKDDITGYISKNTVIPRIFDIARQKCKIAFEEEQSVWRLLPAEPDRYIYDAVEKGVELSLPPEIAAGLKEVSQRTEWNKPAPADYALPTEIWREVVARRNRYEEVYTKLTNGEVSNINDLITYNLNIRQFAQDVIENSEGPELLRAFYHAIESVTILDPTCGSGAFLFAALNILEPLYEACLDRMQVFLDELERSGQKHRPEKFSDFRKTVEQINKHPNRRYFILKSIILNNLFGVDIMEEAVEICKLRLFLKLVAQVEKVEDIEPLPDIDFNIRAGNTLVGFASREEVKEAIIKEKLGEQVQRKLLFGEDIDTMKRIEEKAEDVDQLFFRFRQQQTDFGGEITPKDKENLTTRLKALEDELNYYLAREYGVKVSSPSPSGRGNKGKGDSYAQWLASHKPFHWFIEFYGIMKDGGFDVIIGNPPYVEYTKVKNDYMVRGYETESCGNLYAFIMERALEIISKHKRIGFIVPLSFVSTDGFGSIRSAFCQQNLWVSNYAIRPAKLFEGVEHRLSIVLAGSMEVNLPPNMFATRYRKWQQEERQFLMQLTEYGVVTEKITPRGIPKLGSQLQTNLWKNVFQNSIPFRSAVSQRDSQNKMFYTRKFGHFVLFTNFIPSIQFEDGTIMNPTELKHESLKSETEQLSYLALFNSTLTYWLLVTVADCRNLNKRDILDHPVPCLTDRELMLLSKIGNNLMTEMREKASHVKMIYPGQPPRTIEVLHPGLSLEIVHQIDRVLAEHYGFTDEELDFIINYDIKYRMGRESLDNDST